MPTQTTNIALKNRGVIRLRGKDKATLLQSVITNDIKKLAPDQPLYTALLTPQGKFLFDFFINSDNENDAIFLDCHGEQTQELINKLMMYKLRAEVEIENASDAYNVWAIFDGVQDQADPRHKDLGHRAILKKDDVPQGEVLDYNHYDQLRIRLGIADGIHDLGVNKHFILEANFDKLNGVSFTKGCYVGQEVTARMQYRGVVKKHIYPVQFSGQFSGDAPEYGSIIYCNDKKAGELLSSNGGLALALIKDEYITPDAQFECGEKTLSLLK